MINIAVAEAEHVGIGLFEPMQSLECRTRFDLYCVVLRGGVLRCVVSLKLREIFCEKI